MVILFTPNRPRLLHPQHVERVARAIVEWFHLTCDLNDWVADGARALGLVDDDRINICQVGA